MCSEAYPGVKPSSEKCVQNTMAFLTNLNRDGRVVGSFSMHAYGEYWFVPFAYSKDQRPANYKDQVLYNEPSLNHRLLI
jgi:hypothetical protein